MEPRVPQRQTRISGREGASDLLALPEHGHAADQVAPAAQQRESRDLYLVVLAVETAHPDSAVHGPALPERHHERRPIGAERHTPVVAKGKDGLALLEEQLAHVIEALAQQRLGRLVEKQQVALLVGEQHRHCQTGRQLAHQDQADVPLWHKWIVPAARYGERNEFVSTWVGLAPKMRRAVLRVPDGVRREEETSVNQTCRGPAFGVSVLDTSQPRLRRDCPSMRRALLFVTTIALLGAALAPVGAAAASAKFDRGGQFIVLMADLPVVAYDGSIRGLKATKPAPGTKIDP